MKIGIVTFVKADNYGAELQAYALQRKLNMLGYDAEVLDLEKEQGVMVSSQRNIFIALKKRISYYGIIKGCWKFIQAIVETIQERNAYKKHLDHAKNKHIIFERFFEEKIKHSSDFIKLDDLSTKNLPYDVYVAGSDQIWNHMQTNRLDVYFLMFANRFNAKKISYAASFSVSSLPPELKSEYKKLLDNLDAISVREANALPIIHELTDKPAIQVLDPTLLLTREQWIKEIANPSYISSDKKYVIIYTLSGSKYIYGLAKKIASQLGAEVINIKSGYAKVKGDDSITHITDAGPQEFISLFEKAVYVITDSFHGTAFSINFNIPFTTLLNPVSNINSRALSLLDMCKLESRVIYDDGKNKYPESLLIDFSIANSIIEMWRNKSLYFLEEKIGEQ